MSRLFETVEDFVGFVADVTNEFANTELQEHIVSTMAFFALAHVYRPYTPKMYQRQYTLTNKDYYESDIKQSGYKTSNSELDVYTYSTSPHVKSVVNGYPYDFDFKYNGEPRPYIEYADSLLSSRTGVNELKSRLASFYKDYGLDVQ